MKRKPPPTPAKDMPRVKRAKTNVRRKRRTSNWKYRNSFENRIVKFPRTVVPFTNTTTLKYSESFVNINPPVGSTNAYIFRANDLYDPNLTGVGHQPTGFDQMMALYQKFVVIASKIKVVGYSANDETLDTVLGVTVIRDSGVGTSTEFYLEQPNTDWAVVPGGSGSDPFSVSCAFDTAKWSNTDIKTNDLLHGTGLSSPGLNWYYHIFYGSTGTLDDPGNLKATVEIEFKVMFFEPKSLPIS